jgi:hypothetical protein
MPCRRRSDRLRFRHGRLGFGLRFGLRDRLRIRGQPWGFSGTGTSSIGQRSDTHQPSRVRLLCDITGNARLFFRPTPMYVWTHGR